MVARFHYDDAVFERLLQDRLRPDEQQDVPQHVEGCTSCQSKLEVLAEQGIRWEDVRNFLKDREQSENTRDSNQANSSSVWIGFLEPSERPDSLGRFGRYEILEVLGRGGTGIVMRGHDPSLDRQCAIKVLSPELAASAAARKRFSREAKSAAAVVHEHVVPIQTVDEEQGLPYLVMPVLEGRSLEDRVRKNGPLDVKEILRVGRQIASGLAAAHAQGLIHRDVKPANILLNYGVERVVITDFGLARAADDASMTQSGTLVGTPQYMSPEQAKGESLDVRSDLFSLGSVLYFMSTGHSPFRAETTMGILSRITSDAPRSLTDHNAEFPQWFDQIVRKLLAKRPEDRYATATDVEKLLGDWLAHLQDPARVPRPAEPKTSEGNGRSRITKWIAAALGGFFLLWAGITVVLETGKGTLTIENHSDDIAVRIKKGDKVYDQLTVKKGENKVRLAAGKYVVEFDGKHDGVTIENGSVVLTRGDQKLVRIVEDRHVGIQYARSPYSETRPSFHSDMIKIEGDWVEIPSKDRQPSDVPLRLRIQNGGYIIQWEGKVGSSHLIEVLAGVVHFGSTSQDIEFQPSDGPYFFPRYQPPTGTIYNYRFSGTYKLDDEQLVIEFDSAEVPPKFLLESIPATFCFKRSTESPATFIAGNESGKVPPEGVQRSQEGMPQPDGDLVVPIQTPLLSLADRVPTTESVLPPSRPHSPRIKPEDVYGSPAWNPPKYQPPAVQELIHGPPHVLESKLQGTWTIHSGTNAPELTKHILRFYTRLERGSSEPQVEFVKIVDHVKGIVHRWQGEFHVTSNQGQNHIEIIFNQGKSPTILKGEFALTPSFLTIHWHEYQNAKMLINSDNWNLERGVPLPDPSGSGEVAYVDAMMTAAPRLFALYQYRKRPTYSVFSKVNLTWDHHQFDPALDVTSIVGGGTPVEFDEAVGAFRIRGEDIRSLIAIDTQGTFREHPLKEPFSGTLEPVLDDEVIYYLVNGTVYAFSGRTGTWDQLDDTGLGTLKAVDGSIAVPQPQDGFDTETINGIIVRKADDIFVFRVETGKWEKVDTYPKEEPKGDVSGNHAGLEAVKPSSQKLLDELRNETKIQFANTPLPLVLSYLEKLHKIVIVLDHDAFDEAKISEAVEVSCNFQQGTLAEGLRSILEPYGLRHVVRNGQVVITTIPFSNIPLSQNHPLQLELRSPDEFIEGRPILFQLICRNTGDEPLTNVEIYQTIDRNLKVLARTDPALDSLHGIRWNLPTVEAGQTAIVEVACQPIGMANVFTNHLFVTVNDYEREEQFQVRRRPPSNPPRGVLEPQSTTRLAAPNQMRQSQPWYEFVDANVPPITAATLSLQGTWMEIVEPKQAPKAKTLKIHSDRFTVEWCPEDPLIRAGITGKFRVTEPDTKIEFDSYRYQRTDRNNSLREIDIDGKFEGTWTHGASQPEEGFLMLTITHVDDERELTGEKLPIVWKFRKVPPIKADPPSYLGADWILEDGKLIHSVSPAGVAPSSSEPMQVVFKAIQQSPSGEAILFRATLTNTSEKAMTNVVIREIVDPKLKVTGRTDPADDQDNKIIWRFPRILPNQQAVVEVQCEPPKGPGQFTNQLQVTADGFKYETQANADVGNTRPFSLPATGLNPFGPKSIAPTPNTAPPGTGQWVTPNGKNTVPYGQPTQPLAIPSPPIGDVDRKPLPPELTEIQGRWIVMNAFKENDDQETNHPCELTLTDRSCEILWDLKQPKDLKTKARICVNTRVDIGQRNGEGPVNVTFRGVGPIPDAKLPQLEGRLTRDGDTLTITINQVKYPIHELMDWPMTWRFRRADRSLIRRAADPPTDQQSSLGE